ncbi:VanW family protein [Thermosyntropha sp.]|uniref:VanW family protein n=1 Tax=Thermosyntropha sp. TaxID=2740820 RepID=UPI0025E5F0CD|nr:VanW family protein [Thermosyntropha sp.]MBO8158218.1 VanW family protein [Thermosyntropha sp.]
MKNTKKIPNTFFVILICGIIFLNPAASSAAPLEGSNPNDYITVEEQQNDLNAEKSYVDSSFSYPNKISIEIDGQLANLQNSAFINGDNRAMISAEDAALLFGFSLDMADCNQIWLKKEGISWSFRANELQALQNEETIILDTVPVIIEGEFFLPLRLLAEEAGYAPFYNPAKKILTLRSAGFTKISDNLPLWGTFNEVPVFNDLYPNHKIMTGYYTTLLSKLPNRTDNINLACQKINGQVLYPGQIFSFNQIVGERTPAAGFKKAPVFAGKKVLPGIGGGICQVSSTLYNAVLDIQLKVIERHPHSMKVSYVPYDKDATVSYGIQDFKFCNTRNHPIQILAQVLDKYVIIAIAEVP